MTIKFESTSKVTPLIQIRVEYFSELQSNCDVEYFGQRFIAGDASSGNCVDKWIVVMARIRNFQHAWKM